LSERQYHLRELEIALSSDDPNRMLPETVTGAGRVLDIGCGAGQTLIALKLNGARGYGVDIDLEALRLGRELLREAHREPVDLTAGDGENLPFRDGSFDLVISRVALPYMHIPAVLSEAARVLAPGGEVWFALHPASMFRRSAVRTLRSAVFQCYVVANSILFHLAGRQFRYPLNSRRTESYQTEQGMRRVLAALGFTAIRFQRNSTQFTVSARLPE
jgi:ubiquinone/menaquinone biosynthesis C-methylase UbiE